MNKTPRSAKNNKKQSKEIFFMAKNKDNQKKKSKKDKTKPDVNTPREDNAQNKADNNAEN